MFVIVVVIAHLNNAIVLLKKMPQASWKRPFWGHSKITPTLGPNQISKLLKLAYGYLSG